MFKEVTGFGFSEYVNLTRVRQAQLLLKETGISVTAVSEQCGFGNFSHFGKIFKQLSGVSPREYRLFNR
ncbi:HTH-type transcriptional activator RhaR [compost metagenome]